MQQLTLQYIAELRVGFRLRIYDCAKVESVQNETTTNMANEERNNQQAPQSGGDQPGRAPSQGMSGSQAEDVRKRREREEGHGGNQAESR